MRNVIVALICGLVLVGCHQGGGDDRDKLSENTESTHEPSRTFEGGDEKELVSYLTTPVIDPEVKKVAQDGVSRYNDPTTKLKDARSPKTTGAGRKTATWISDTFGITESQILAQFKKLNAPQTFTVAVINQAYDDLVKKHPADQNLKKAQFVLVKGLNVNYLHEAPLGKDSILQLASQFNYLESPGAYMSPVVNYLGDFTQGPMGSIEAAAAALHRMAAVQAGKLHGALANVLPSNHSKYYNFGYLEPFKLLDPELTSLINHIKTNLTKRRILPQWVINEASGNLNIQVFAAAPSYQGDTQPKAGSLGAQICSLLVAEQYEAIAKIAVVRSLSINKPVALHLTLVGQKAFNNPPEVMKDAFTKVAHVVMGYPQVRVYVHGFNAGAQSIIRDQSDKNLIVLSEMDDSAFMTATF